MRERLYKEVKRLSERGFGSRRIQRILLEKYSKSVPDIVHLSRDTIKNWMKDKHNPLGRATELIESYPALQYVIGAILSDGCVYVNKYKTRSTMYVIDLKVRDYEFAAEFARNLRELGIVVKIRRVVRNKRLYYAIVFSNYKLFKILINERLWKKYVRRHPGGFLRGYFDGDGGSLLPHFTSKDQKMLRFIRKILIEHFGIRCSRIVKLKPRESEIDGRKIKSRQAYILNIHPFDYKKLYEIVKPSIPRKDHLLKLSIEIAERENFRKRIIEAGDKWSEEVNIIRCGVAKVLRRKKKSLPSIPEIYAK
ncbi:MAG: LAGLIDADG family homing endonuclease [Nitrososphaerota archaeon]